MLRKTYDARVAKMPQDDRREFEAWAVRHLHYEADWRLFTTYTSHHPLSRLEGYHAGAVAKGSSRVGYYRAAVLFKRTSQLPESVVARRKEEKKDQYYA